MKIIFPRFFFQKKKEKRERNINKRGNKPSINSVSVENGYFSIAT